MKPTIKPIVEFHFRKTSNFFWILYDGTTAIEEFYIDDYKNLGIYQIIYKIIDIETIYVAEKFYHIIGTNDLTDKRILKYPVLIPIPDEIAYPELYIDYEGE